MPVCGRCLDWSDDADCERCGETVETCGGCGEDVDDCDCDPDGPHDPDDADGDQAACENCGGPAHAYDGPEAGHDMPGGWWCRRCVAEEEGEEE